MSVKASRAIVIHFTSKGGAYSAIWMSDRGDLYQEFEKVDAATTNYYPQITSASPITMHLSVASARMNVLVTPQSVTYFANGTELAFDTSGACTTSGFSGLFKKNGSGDLQIIGNLGQVANNASFQLQAKVAVSANGADVLWVSAPVTMAPYLGGDNARVTIAPGDDKNYTIRESGDSCILKALVTKGGVEVTSGLTYEWYVFKSGAFTTDLDGNGKTVTTKTLTVLEGEVDTYALYKLVVKENGTEIGSDTQGVMDASDPYDILVSTWVNDGGGGNDVSTNNLELNDEMPDTAYIKVKATLVVRGETTAAVVGGTKKYEFSVVSSNGASMFGQAASASDTFNITVANMTNLGAGIGDYEVVVDCTVD